MLQETKAYNKIRDKIIENLDIEFIKYNNENLDTNVKTKTIKFKSLISNMKYKAKHLLKNDRTLNDNIKEKAIFQNEEFSLTQEPENVVLLKPVAKENITPAVKGKILIKPQKQTKKLDDSGENSNRSKFNEDILYAKKQNTFLFVE